MRLRYFLALAAGLTACTSPDAQHAAPAGARPLLAQPAAPSHSGAPAAPQPLAAPVVQPAAPRQLRPWPASAPSPTTLADATPSGEPAAYELSSPEVPEAPRRTLSAADTAIGGAKAAQTFWLQPGRDTVVLGREGTTIWVPAGAFASATTGAPLPAGPIALQLQEFYSLPDILLNNLSTDSSHGLLETGGMLHLAARSASGQPCTLRPGVELLLRMPAARPKPDMQLFTGVRTAGGRRLDWQRPRPALPPAEFRPNGPEAPKGEGPLLAFLRQRLAFSAEAAQRLRATQRRPQRRALRRASRFSGRRWVEYGRLTVAVDRRGTVVNASVAGLRDSALQAQLCAAARQLPAFQPATLTGPVRRRPAAVPRSYLTINRKRRIKATPLPQLPVAGSWTVEVGFDRTGRVWFPWPGNGYVNELGGSASQPVFAADSARRQLRQASTQALQATSLDTLSGYLFSAASLGWANCDRTGQLGSRRIYFTVETDAPDTRVQLVFRRARAVIASDGERPGTRLQQFHSSPVGERATLVAIKREHNITYLALKDVVLSERVEKDLPFRPVSAEELRNALAKIDQ